MVKKRRDKGKISSEGYRAIQDVLDNTEEELDNNRRQLNALIGKLNRILVANAKEVANEVANIVLINALDEAGREMRELNNSRNAEMIDILFDKQ